MDFTVERKCIHDLANHLSIVQGAVKKVLRNFEEKGIELPEEAEKLTKADDYIKRSIESLKLMRAELQEKISSSDDAP